MKEKNQELAKKMLKPHRQSIDKLDKKIIKLLSQRYGIVKKVAKIKIENEIPAFIGPRVDEVRDNAVALAKQYGIDPQFTQTLYTLIIYQACAMEDLMKIAYLKKKKKK